jgi:hypothetical protein
MGQDTKSQMIKIGLVSIALCIACPIEAHAALKASVNAVIAGMKFLPQILSIAAYIYGAGTVLAGAWKLKTHAEEPAKASLLQGLSRIGIGGAFSALPALITWVNNSLAMGNFKLLFQSLTHIT